MQDRTPAGDWQPAFRERVEGVLRRVLAARRARARPAAPGDALCRARRRQAHPAPARLRDRQRDRRRACNARCAGGGCRADPRLLARSRRPARHGRRRPASRPADDASRLRRGDGDPRGRRAAGPRLRPACERADAGRRRRGPRRDDPPARAGERHGRHGRRPGDGSRGDRPAPRAAADRGNARAQDRRIDARLGAHRLRREPTAARRQGATHSTATAAQSASASRSSTTCSTCSAIPR